MITNEELTNRLICKEEHSVSKPEFYVSKVTGKEYDFTMYTNHGYGQIYRGFLDLPIDEYPFVIKYKKVAVEAWKNYL